MVGAVVVHRAAAVAAPLMEEVVHNPKRTDTSAKEDPNGGSGILG
jgi:hypothetical protein